MPLIRELRPRLGSTAATASSPPQQLSSTSGGGGQDGHEFGSGKILPFEFRALEVCLELAFKFWEQESSTLEKEAYPALDELSSKVSTLNLERVRQIKSRLVAISGRVQKVRDELEHLLDDDMDMAAMHLSEKLAYQVAGQSSRFHIGKEARQSDEDRSRDDEIEDDEGGKDHSTSTGFPLRINELEGLLEAYFVRIDGTLNKLSTLREYVDDTEDYINIMLDDKQNQLLQMGILLSTATLVITCGILITGVLAINIHIPLYKFPTIVFWQATAGIIGGMVVLFAMALFYYRTTGILR
ncbi:putative magnesium transporter MRS2-D [Miscanthus floridulus]|uniref:putative magnesium transporter MRS2-D n=1 Tax=Miscanthus floridulus TaxID=154761 RepID=UPI003459DDB0